MALLRIDHTPTTVDVNLPLYVTLPGPGQMGNIPVRNRKVLYLLHGMSDDGSAWQRFSSIETLANAYGLVVIMPSAGRSFYSDLPNGQCYFSYLVDELPKYLEDVFGLAPKREDTLIAGNSMGGYGAFKAAFHYPDRFAAAASFSGLLSFEFFRAFPNDPRLNEFKYLFGDLDKLTGSDNDPAVWFQKAAANPAALPGLYMSSGRQEDIYPLYRMALASLQALSIPVNAYEEDASHDWFFWDKQIKQFLASVLGNIPNP